MPELTVHFFNNFSDYFGGGLFCWSCTPQIENSRSSLNDCSYNGGAIYLYFADASLSHCTFIDNGASYYGAALSLTDSHPIIDYCLFVDNDASFQGGVMFAEWGEATFTNCTFTENSANYGGALYLAFADANVTNSIFWKNTGMGSDIYIDGFGNADVNYCDIEGDWGGTGNIEEDPLFVDPGSGDFSLQRSSPCVNTGDPDSNVPIGGACVVDMGVFEFDQGFNCRKHREPIPKPLAR